MTKVIDAENLILSKPGNWPYPDWLVAMRDGGDTLKPIDLEPLIDKRIAAAFLDLVEHSQLGGPVADALVEVALKLDPPAKPEVRLNPCGKCGEPAMQVSVGGFNCSANCNRYEVNAKNWNAANPIKPAEEKRYRPGQRFRFGSAGPITRLVWDYIMRRPLLLNEDNWCITGVLKDPDRCGAMQWTMQELGLAVDWQPLDGGAQ